jgi:hypothetical protein
VKLSFVPADDDRLPQSAEVLLEPMQLGLGAVMCRFVTLPFEDVLGTFPGDTDAVQ